MERDPSEELFELARALRAHAEWQLACGADGLPAETNPARVQFAEAGPATPAASSGRPAAAAPAPAAPGPGAQRPAGAPTAVRAEAQKATPPEHPAATPRLSASAPAAGPRVDAAPRLAVLAEQARQCTACGLHAGRKQAVFSRGTGSSRLCFVGEGPGADEDEQGFPFVGKAGQLLDRMIAAMGFDRDEVYVCNVVKCRPPNNRKPEPSEMAACAHFLEQQIELIDPEVIVALGATAVEGLFGSTSGGITRMRGRIKLYKGRIAVMPTFHPAYLLRNPAAKADVWKDLQAVVRQMGRELPAKK